MSTPNLPSAGGGVPGEPEPFLVEWHRADRGKQMLRIFVISFVLLMTGAVLASIAMLGGRFAALAPYTVMAGIGGAITVVSAPSYALYHFHKLLATDLTLSLYSHGLSYGSDSVPATFIGWSQLARVESPEEGVLLLHTDHAGPIRLQESFGKVSSRALCERIMTVRSRALHGLLERKVAPARG